MKQATLLVGKPRKFYRNLWNAEDHGSDRLFLACWSELLGWRWVETYDTYNEVLKKLDEIASFKVNNSRSSFYIYGR